MNTLHTRMVLRLVTLIAAVVALITITITVIHAFGTSEEQGCPQWPLLGSRQESPPG